jgi:hypothetical protein
MSLPICSRFICGRDVAQRAPPPVFGHEKGDERAVDRDLIHWIGHGDSDAGVSFRGASRLALLYARRFALALPIRETLAGFPKTHPTRDAISR